MHYDDVLYQTKWVLQANQFWQLGFVTCQRRQYFLGRNICFSVLTILFILVKILWILSSSYFGDHQHENVEHSINNQGRGGYMRLFWYSSSPVNHMFKTKGKWKCKSFKMVLRCFVSACNERIAKDERVSVHSMAGLGHFRFLKGKNLRSKENV